MNQTAIFQNFFNSLLICASIIAAIRIIYKLFFSHGNRLGSETKTSFRVIIGTLVSILAGLIFVTGESKWLAFIIGALIGGAISYYLVEMVFEIIRGSPPNK